MKHGVMRKFFRNFFLGFGGLIAVIAVMGLIFGPTWEQYERHQAALEFPAPGRLLNIGGRRIQIDCRGTGSPTVVFESGGGIQGALSWAKVHDPVAKFTRACAYSRAGILWSDDKDGSHDGVGVAKDLHATLAAAGENGPFVLVGHSLGGPYITIYAKLFGDQVVGLVYVDASHPDQQKRIKAGLGRLPKSFVRETLYKFATHLSWTGVVRLGALFLVGGPNMPNETIKISKAFTSNSLAAALAEMHAMPATLDEAGTFRNLGDRPIVVLTHMRPTPEGSLKAAGLSTTEGEKLDSVWLDLQNDMSSWSSRSTHRIVSDAGHGIQFDRPSVVVTAIREVVDNVRTNSSR